MAPRIPVHEIRLGSVRACIWEERSEAGISQESDFSVSIVRHGSPQEPARFGVDDLPLVAQVMDLAHLWIHEQAVGV
jgi:hypothetical protein